jgi:hypothetical protein
MSRLKSQLNNASKEVIEKNILLQNPEGLPTEVKGLPDEVTGIVISKEIPKMKKVVFLNGRDPGETLYFHYHSKTHPLKQYTLYHGQEHELPVEVIEHLESCGESIYAYRTGRDGHPEMYRKSMKYIFQFKSSKVAYV